MNEPIKYQVELTRQEIETIADILRNQDRKDVYDLFLNRVLDMVI